MDKSCINRKRQRKENDKNIEECFKDIEANKTSKCTPKERAKTYRDRK